MTSLALHTHKKKTQKASWRMILPSGLQDGLIRYRAGYSLMRMFHRKLCAGGKSGGGAITTMINQLQRNTSKPPQLNAPLLSPSAGIPAPLQVRRVRSLVRPENKMTQYTPEQRGIHPDETTRAGRLRTHETAHPGTRWSPQSTVVLAASRGKMDFLSRGPQLERAQYDNGLETRQSSSGVMVRGKGASIPLGRRGNRVATVPSENKSVPSANRGPRSTMPLATAEK